MTPSARVSCAIVGLALAAMLGCAGGGGRTSLSSREAGASSLAYQPDRRDYFAFREAHPELLDPNYLPFMVHRFEGDAARGDVLLFCRWPDAALPLRFFIEVPEIDPHVQDEFDPVDPARLVDAVALAFEEWEAQLGGAVRFERVDRPGDARLRVAMYGDEAPEATPGRRVLGRAEGLTRACVAHAPDPDRDGIVTSFEMPTIALHLADEHGLLAPEQVRRLALHEIGHALGMRGHSPSPGDLMYPRLDRALPRAGLSRQDVNSFVSLYSMEPGARYGEVPIDPSPPAPASGPPGGGPLLALAPWVDARFGVEMRLPAGWMRIEESHGLLATHGPSWDHDASLRVLVWPAEDVESFLDRYRDELLGGSWFLSRREMVMFGRPAQEIEVEDESGTYQQRFRFIELPDERVMMLVSEAPRLYAAEWQPWFDAALDTLEVWRGTERIGAGASVGEGESRGEAR